ncbi:MAG: hypothetical protein EXS09_01275 [Gemmataceae bacterium]|nr:hypothetical protein [Gemmataceae bacterium]
MSYTKFALCGLLAMSLVTVPVFAEPADDLKKAVEKLDKAAKELQEAKEAFKIDELRAKAIKIDTTIELIDKDIQDIKKDIRDIKRKLEVGPSTSLKSESKYPGQGKVRFINEFNEEMSVVVNGRSYRLVPGQERLVAVPPGNFTYQVLQLQRVPQERKITADETKTVRIFPLQ